MHVLSSIPLTQFVIPAHPIGYYLPPPLPSAISAPLPIASTQSVIPAHSVFGCSLSFLYHHFHLSLLRLFPLCLDPVGHSGPLGLWLLPFFLSPFTSAPFLSASTQLVIPAHSVFGFFLPFSSPSSSSSFSQLP